MADGKTAWQENLGAGIINDLGTFRLLYFWNSLVYVCLHPKYRSNRTVLGWCVIPFLIPDFVKIGLALALGGRLSKIIKIDND